MIKFFYNNFDRRNNIKGWGIMNNDWLDKLGFSTRTRNALKNADVRDMNKLLSLTESDLISINNLGEKSIKEVLMFQKKYRIYGDAVFSKSLMDTVNDLTLIQVARADISNFELNSIVYKSKKGDYKKDLGLHEIDFSVRTTNSLTKHGYNSIKQVASLNYDDFRKIKGLGKKSIGEVVQYLKESTKYLEKSNRFIDEIFTYICKNVLNQDTKWHDHLKRTISILLLNNVESIKEILKSYACVYLDRLIRDNQFVKLIWFSDEFMFAYEKYIFSCVSEQKLQDNKEKNDFFKQIGLYKEIIDKLLRDKKIEQKDGEYRVQYPSIGQWIFSIENEKYKQIIKMKLDGKTLQECGDEFGISRERVRQIIVKLIKEKPRVEEDYYRIWFEKYDISKEEFAYIFNEKDRTYNYLKMAYKHGVLSINEMIDDCNLNRELYRSVKKYLNKDSILIDGEYVVCKRDVLCKKVAELYCSEHDMSGNELYDIYVNFLQSRGLNKNKKLLFPNERSFYEKLEDSRYIIIKNHKRCRFYLMDEMDIVDFVNRLHLEQFNNIEISSLKLFVENKTLMEEYGINDEYELHNLLKKTQPRWNKHKSYDVKFTRMPFISFGEVDRKKQVLDLLNQLSPLSADELCENYQLKYGVLKKTVTANFLQYAVEYNHNGIYIIDQTVPNLNQEEMIYLKEKMNKCFYFLEDVRKIYRDKFGDKYLSRINSFTLRKLGFRVYTNYIVSNSYQNAQDYFTKCLLAKDTFDFSKIENRLKNVSNFMTVLDDLKHKFVLLEFEDAKFIKLSRIQEVYPDISEKTFLEYTNEVIDYSKNEKYFTIKKLIDNGFNHRLHNIGLDEWFVSSIVKNSKKIRFIRIGGNILFYQGNKQYSTVDFIRFLMKKLKKINIYSFIDYLSDEYGIKLRKEKIVDLINYTEMYYDSIMEKVYYSKDYYYDEF